jgi:glyoxylate reductase
MARILISTPMLEGCLDALAGHELVSGPPGSEPSAEALICPPTMPVGAGELRRMPRLRVIGLAGAGSDAVDLAAPADRRIVVLTAGEPLVETTADLAFGLIIATCRLMHDAESLLREGRWRGWGFDHTFGRDVNGSTLGLVGYGAIARAVATRARGFSMRVIHHSRSPTGEEGWRGGLDELLRESDIVSVHVPLTDATRGLIDRRRLALMRPDAVLVNTARGAVVDEVALAEALAGGRLLAAGLDVYSEEPGLPRELLDAPRTVLLPHIGSATDRTRRSMLRAAAEKVAAALAGP